MKFYLRMSYANREHVRDWSGNKCKINAKVKRKFR